MAMRPYKALDYLGIDDEFSHEERMIRDSVRDFVSKEVLPIVEKCNREGIFPKQLVPQIAELGLLGANIKGYDCAGVNNVAYGLIMQELERGDSGIRSFVSVQGALVMYPIYAFGSEEQKKKYLPGMAKGELIGCFGLTEPDFGSNPNGMRTRAVKTNGGYTLNGAKMWITNGNLAHVALIWGKVKDETGADVIRGFLVDTKSKGFTAKEIKGKFSLRVSVTSELILENVFVPEDHVLPGVKGIKGPLSCLTQARYGIAWGAVGAAQGCFDEALSYVMNRPQFDNKPLASHQLIQNKLAIMATEITKAQLLVLRLGRMKDKGVLEPQHVSMAKMNNVSKALEIARVCRDMLGANGICDEYHTGRHMCNLESVNTYEGTQDIHALIIGNALTGIPSFRPPRDD
jgi:glutaryl-CoA dehydrogenase